MDSVTRINKKRRKKRRKQTAEVFTPSSLVNEILDKLPEEVWQKDKTFLDPACGNGNFLIWILLTRISKGQKPTEALNTIYGLDIKRDNIRECRLRLLKVFSLYKDITKEHVRIIFQNIRFLNQSNWPNGSLDYDMSFENNSNEKNVAEWLQRIEKGELELVDLPVEDKDIPAKYIDMFNGAY